MLLKNKSMYFVEGKKNLIIKKIEEQKKIKKKTHFKLDQIYMEYGLDI